MTWTLASIPWNDFDRSQLDPALVAVAKTACLVEHNAPVYTRYLSSIFRDDPIILAAAKRWGDEELQHGQALRQWCELADPTFDFPTAFSAFTKRILLPEQAVESVRGSKTGELLARCVVESGTSFFYSGLRDAAREPVLRAICARIASDEFRHYSLFHKQAARLQHGDFLGLWARWRILIGRMVEGEDDELAYAWHCVNEKGTYSRRVAQGRYFRSTLPILRRDHFRRCLGMVLRAAGIEGRTGWVQVAALIGLSIIRMRMRYLARWAT